MGTGLGEDTVNQGISRFQFPNMFLNYFLNCSQLFSDFFSLHFSYFCIKSAYHIARLQLSN